MKILTTEFFERDTTQVAHDLIGKKLIRKLVNNKSSSIETITAIITETESYKHGDPASHCFDKITSRNSIMFGPVGHAYVYLSYGIHYCFNIVAHDSNTLAGGVLIRSVILENKKENSGSQNLKNIKIAGPGNLTKALFIDKSLYGINLLDINSELIVIDSDTKINLTKIKKTPRVGISKAKENLWRFVLTD